MKKIIILALILAVGAMACSPKKTEGTKLGQASPAYKLAKDLTAVLPVFDPDKNAVLLTAEKFTVTVGDVAELIQGTMGVRASAELSKYPPDQLKQALTQTAVQIGERKILLAAATKAKITISPEELNQALAVQYTQSGGEEKFLEAIKTNGVDIAFVKKMIGDDLAIRKHLEKNVVEAITVSEAEIQKAYSEDKTASVRHILLMTQGKPEAEKPAIRKKMEDILARVKKGEDFAALTKEFTEDPGFKDNGGLYENFPRGQMVPAFNDAAFSVPVGQISDIVETEYGLHILKIENRMKETEPLEKVKAAIVKTLRQPKQPEAIEKYITDLKSQAKFVISSI